ncbi:MAG TPA: hypothetical protein VMI54_14290 [Polyangiaceae bacterium]|nr:hypothetical protein [Polyangiaceae bacterium]
MNAAAGKAGETAAAGKGGESSGGKGSGGASSGGTAGGEHTGGTAGEQAGGAAGAATGGTGATSEAGASGRSEGGASGTNEGGTSGHGEAGASGANEAGAGGSASFDCSRPSPDDAPTITVNVVAGDPPNMTGGDIFDGVYYQTSEDDYNGQDSENAQRRVFVFDQVEHRFADGWIDGSDAARQVVGGLSVSSPTFTISARECGGGDGTLTISYTATSTTLTLIDPNHANRVLNLVKQ